MAVITKSPARGRASITTAPEGSYEQVASKYAEQFISAKRQKKQNELNTKIVQWQNNEISYEDLKKYLEDRANGAKDNSTEKVEMLQMLNQVKAQQEKIVEANNQQKVLDKRTELIEKYKDKGVSNQEQLSIIQELRSVADPNSNVYKQLVAEEAEIRGAIEKEKASGGGAALTNEFNESITAIEAADNQAEFAYQRGEITGFARDQIRLGHAQELTQIVSNYAASGKSVPESVLTSAYNFQNGAEKMLDLREQGLLADSVNQDGQVVRIATNENNFGREILFSPTQGLQMGDIADISSSIKKDPMAGTYTVTDPNTGEDKVFFNKTDAMQFAKDNNAFTFNVLVPDPSQEIEMVNSVTGEKTITSGTRQVEMNRDPRTGAFYETSNPTNVYAILPSTTKDLETYKIQNVPQSWLGNEEIGNQLSQMVTQARGGEQNIDLTIDIPEVNVEAVQEDDGFFKNLFDTGKNFLKDVFDKKVAPEISELSMSGSQLLSNLKSGKPIDFMSQLKQSPVGPVIEPKSNFTMPNIPTLNIPEFKMPNINFSSSANTSPNLGSFVSNIAKNVTSPVTTPTTSESQGIGSKIKNFGQNIWSGVKNILGF